MRVHERLTKKNFKRAGEAVGRLLPEGLFGLCMAFSFVAGYRLDTRGYTIRTAWDGITFLAALLLLSVPCALICLGTEKGVKRLRSRSAAAQTPNLAEKEAGHKTDVKWFLLYLLLLFVIWLPVFLAFYPVIFAYDAEMQMYQVISGSYSTHHPLIHTLMLGLCHRIGGQAGSVTASMAAYSLLQMTVMACVFAFTLAWMRRREMNRGIRLAAFLFYGFFPVHSMLAVSVTKDVVFAGLTLLFTVFTADRVVFADRKAARSEKGGGKNGIWRAAGDGLYLLTAVLMLLFRNNAVYAFIFAALMSLLFWKGQRKRAAIVSGTVLALFLLGSVGLKTVLAAESGSPREMLSVLFEQMARLSVDQGDEMEPALKADLDQYLSPDWVWTYDPHLADPIKSRVDIRTDPAGMIKCWLRLGIRYPEEYIDAFLAETQGYWYLGDTSYARIYGDQKGSGMGYLSTQRRSMPGGMDIEYHSFLPRLRELLVTSFSDNAYLKIPLLSVVFSPAFYAWLLFFYVWLALKEKQWRLLAPAAYLVGYVLTLLLAPAALMRYMYAVVVCIPMLAGVQCTGKIIDVLK